MELIGRWDFPTNQRNGGHVSRGKKTNGVIIPPPPLHATKRHLKSKADVWFGFLVENRHVR